MMRACWIIVTLLVAPASVAAQPPTESLTSVFEAGNVAGSRGDYASAISHYERLAQAGVRDPDVYFNLATSWAQSGDYARAILNFERGLTLRPGDAKALEGLRSAEKALEEQRAEKEGEATIQRSSSISDAVYGSLTEDGLAAGLLLANLLFFAALGWVSIGRRRQGWLYALLFSSAVVLVFCALGLGAKEGLYRDGPRAVALDDRVVLRDGPDPRAQIRGTARGGDRGEIVDADGDFVKLQVVSGLEGWAPSSAVGAIDLGHGVH